MQEDFFKQIHQLLDDHGRKTALDLLADVDVDSLKLL